MIRPERSIRIRKLKETAAGRDYDHLTPEQRLALLWELTKDAWAFMGKPVDESRLPRHVVRVIRRGR